MTIKNIKMKTLKNLINYRKNRNCTLLCIGPMSKNCVDATIQLADQYKSPLTLIASRRQVDSEQFGGGYVENWTSKNFSNYVRRKDKNKNIIIARDHGGPWQNDIEKTNKLNLKEAMQSAKESYKADIDAGFQILHIDPSIDIHSNPDTNQILERIFELYEFCWSYSQKKNKEILFEIGTEEQTGHNNTKEELIYTLDRMKRFCLKNKIPFPFYIVVQTGTKVMEQKNIGTFDSPIRIENQLPPEIQIPQMIEICNQFEILLKQHNTDYLMTESLKWQPRLGIHAANVAPEFGVAETCALIKLLEDGGHQHLLDKFLELAYESKKWKKWILKDSKTNDKDKAILAGHYIFSKEPFKKLKYDIKERIDNLDFLLQKSVKNSIERYMIAFNLV